MVCRAKGTSLVPTLVVRLMMPTPVSLAIGKGFDHGPKNMPRLRVHRELGKVVARMLVCSIRSIDYIVGQDCGNVCRCHSSGKHSYPCDIDSTVDYDNIIPEFLDAEGKEDVA